MGAGVAAGPHCPFASNPAWEARRSALGGFEKSAPEPGAPLPFPPESIHGRSRFRFPRWLPDQGRSPGGSPLGGLELAFRFPPSRFRKPKPSVPQPAGSSAEASVPPGSPGPKSWACRFAAPGPKPGPARPIRAEALFRRWRRADLSPAFRRAGPGPEGPVSGLPVPQARRLSVPMGASRSLPLSHPLKGKPAASAWRRLRQPPCLSLPPVLPPEGDRPGIRSGCGWEGSPPLPEDRLGHVRKLS